MVTYPLPGRRGSDFIIGADVDIADVPVVDGATLHQTYGNTGHPGATGTVRSRYRGNAETGLWEIDSGGAHLYDCGLVTIADLIANGPKALYFPPGLVGVWFDFMDASGGSSMVDKSAQITVGTATQVDAFPIQVYYQGGVAVQNFIDQMIVAELSGVLWWPMGYTTDLISAYIVPSDQAIAVPNALTAWAPNHGYGDRECIAQVDPNDAKTYIWSATAGTSGGSLPVFDHTATPVSDNDIGWDVRGELPTTGGVRVILWVAPVEPAPALPT